MQKIGNFDPTMSAAGYQDTEITQDLHLRERGEVPLKPGPKQQEREHVRAEKIDGGEGPR